MSDLKFLSIIGVGLKKVKRGSGEEYSRDQEEPCKGPGAEEIFQWGHAVVRSRIFW